MKKAFSAPILPLTKSKKSRSDIFNVSAGDALVPSFAVIFWSFTVTTQLAWAEPVRLTCTITSTPAALAGLNFSGRTFSKNSLGVKASIKMPPVSIGTGPFLWDVRVPSQKRSPRL